MKRELQEKATSNYVLGDLIGHSISRLFSSNATYPDINKVYPTLFDEEEVEEEKQKKKDELSILRFKQFAQSFNTFYKKDVKKENE